MAAYDLPDLPYDYGALAPHISPEIMELHHSKHHATYVKGLNTALEKLEEARDSNSFDSVVVLPAPFGPTRANIHPRRTSRSR